MANITVDIDLNEVDIEDIFSHIKMIKRSGHYDKELLQFLKDINVEIAKKDNSAIVLGSKVDQWKDELWPQIKEKHSLEELEKLI